ncbi:hypothetical protein [Caproiciproducens galactitolivorans]|uniref:Uncharacterized protein n=1 Tax=Caproiciproducens galactitolivorans TaxID=642589 RepID=A0ABT4BUQ3_9FIRM|nr:hypothetical protein [Caproiciproducens galactitolivorans]MCY1714634.1 hypothetical protein [Caproiciproducens galactitolivorans]
MDSELKKQLEWINANLNTIAENQARLYCELLEIEKKLSGRERKE